MVVQAGRQSPFCEETQVTLRVAEIGSEGIWT